MISKKRNSLFLKNRRGQGLSTNAIILIILGVLVLIMLIAGFTIGWKKILPILDTNNVKEVVTSCSTACVTDSLFDFCSQQRNIKAGDADLTGTCFDFSTNEEYALYGIEECPAIPCPSS